MTLFWLLGAALAAAVGFVVLRPLFRKRDSAMAVSRSEANVGIYRDQRRELDADLAAGKLSAADHARARRELEARLLEDVAQPAQAKHAGRRRGLAFALAGAIPLGALAIYLAVGNPQGIEGPPEQDVEVLVERLAAAMRANPDDPQGWKLLGRTYAALGRFAEATDAYAKAALLAPRDADLLADFADALAMVRGESLEGEPEQLVQRALEIDPGNLKALALAGTAAYARKDFAGAAAYWKRMLPQVPADSDYARTIQSNVDEAMKLAASVAHPLKGVVRLAPGLEGKVDPEDTVFIYARAAEGGNVPLAVQRLKARELPASFALDDTMAMAPGQTLSAHARVVITARVSKSGQPAAQPGDLQGASGPVDNNATAVAVVIDTVVR